MFILWILDMIYIVYIKRLMVFLVLLRYFWFFFLELEEVLMVDGNYKFMFVINN